MHADSQKSLKFGTLIMPRLSSDIVAVDNHALAVRGRDHGCEEWTRGRFLPRLSVLSRERRCRALGICNSAIWIVANPRSAAPLAAGPVQPEPRRQFSRRESAEHGAPHSAAPGSAS